MKTYVPRNKFQVRKSHVLFLYFTSFFSIVFVSPIGYFLTLATFPPVPPIVMGWLNGLILKVGSKELRIASPLLVVLCAVILGVLSYAALHYGQYLKFRGEMREFVIQETGTNDPDQINQMIDDLLLDVTGATGIWGYLQFTANEVGVSALRISSSFGNVVAEGVWAWLYWLFELLILVVISAYMGKRAASQPFCYSCQNWYEYEHLGSVDFENKTSLLRLVEDGDYQRAGTMVVENDSVYPTIELYLGECQCDEDVEEYTVLKIAIATAKQTGLKVKDLVSVMLTVHETSLLMDAIPE